jgi:predicted GTPase
VAFPWDNLISAAAGVVGGLGGGLGSVWLKARYDSKQARQQRTDAQADAVQDSYALLVVTARLAAANMRQMHTWYGAASGARPDEEMLPVMQRSDQLAHELSQAVAVVQLTGTEKARIAAGKLIDAARDVSALFQERSQLMQDTDAKPAQRARLAPFDSEAAGALIDAVQAATDEFITAARTEKRALLGRH